MKKDIKILAIESSCDETAAAVIAGDGKNPPSILSNVVSSQIDLHTKTGGVVPEVASRAHMEAITPVITQALLQSKNPKSKILNPKQNPNDQNSKPQNVSRLNKSNFNIVSDPPAGRAGLEISASDLSQEAIDYLKNEITHIAVTAGPGLIGSLLVGFNAAKALAYALDKPIIPINHIEGHIYSALAEEIRNPKFEILNKIQNPNVKSQKNADLLCDTCYVIHEFNFPLLALVVSGGHTSLILMKNHGQYEIIGQTLDDAAGEAFDKVAKLLDLGYPGGPVISKLASQFRDKDQISKIKYQKEGKGFIIFPRPLINDKTFNFSFSGLKTAVLYEVKRRSGDCPRRGLFPDEKAEIAAAFETAVVDVLVTKTMRAIEKHRPKTVILAGGVAANNYLRQNIKYRISNIKNKVDLLYPPLNLCGDNAAMIGLAAYYHVLRSDVSSWGKIKVDANWELG